MGFCKSCGKILVDDSGARARRFYYKQVFCDDVCKREHTFKVNKLMKKIDNISRRQREILIYEGSTPTDCSTCINFSINNTYQTRSGELKPRLLFNKQPWCLVYGPMYDWRKFNRRRHCLLWRSINVDVKVIK